MHPWLETFWVVMLALAGVVLGRRFGRMPKPYWLLGYFIPLALAGLIGSARYFPALEFVPPISWLMAGRTEFALTAIIVTMLLTTPLSRISDRRLKVLVNVFIVLAVFYSAVWPFLGPALNRNYLAALKTNIDAQGICRQSNGYNCGPAAAVTALRKLGLPAEEGQIAILAHTCQALGTPPDLLRNALQERYGADGLACEYRRFKKVSELTLGGITLAVIKFNFWVDHYVTVLEVSDKAVIVGDPLSGKHEYSPEEFAKIWRFTGVVLKRETKR